jgi:hypothetical protein
MAGFSGGGSAVGGPGPSAIQAQSVMVDRRGSGLSPQEALQRGVGMAHRSIVYVHQDLRNFDEQVNKATVL